MKNEFDISQAKTGMRLTFEHGRQMLFIKGLYNEYSGEGDVVIDPTPNSHCWDSVSSCTKNYGKIMKVEVPQHGYDIFYRHHGFRVIWEYQEETEQQKKIRELEETINKAQAQIEALKKESN